MLHAPDWEELDVEFMASRDPLTGADPQAWVTRQIMAVASRHCQGRVISCLEGGYNLDCLARGVVSHVGELVGAG